jgi:hypothetical protein
LDSSAALDSPAASRSAPQRRPSGREPGLALRSRHASSVFSDAGASSATASGRREFERFETSQRGAAMDRDLEADGKAGPWPLEVLD